MSFDHAILHRSELFFDNGLFFTVARSCKKRRSTDA